MKTFMRSVLGAFCLAGLIWSGVASATWHNHGGRHHHHRHGGGYHNSHHGHGRSSHAHGSYGGGYGSSGRSGGGCSGRAIHTGPKGGRYCFNAHGKKQYVRH